jgi:hypothetical protein
MELGNVKRVYTVEPIVLPVPEPAPPADEAAKADRVRATTEVGSKR